MSSTSSLSFLSSETDQRQPLTPFYAQLASKLNRESGFEGTCAQGDVTLIRRSKKYVSLILTDRTTRKVQGVWNIHDDGTWERIALEPPLSPDTLAQICQSLVVTRYLPTLEVSALVKKRTAQLINR